MPETYKKRRQQIHNDYIYHRLKVYCNSSMHERYASFCYFKDALYLCKCSLTNSNSKSILHMNISRILSMTALKFDLFFLIFSAYVVFFIQVFVFVIINCTCIWFGGLKITINLLNRIDQRSFCFSCRYQ